MSVRVTSWAPSERRCPRRFGADEFGPPPGS